MARELLKASAGDQSAGLLIETLQRDGCFLRIRAKLLDPGLIMSMDDTGGIQSIKISICRDGSLMQKSVVAQSVALFSVSGTESTTVGSVAELYVRAARLTR